MRPSKGMRIAVIIGLLFGLAQWATRSGRGPAAVVSAVLVCVCAFHVVALRLDGWYLQRFAKMPTSTVNRLGLSVAGAVLLWLATSYLADAESALAVGLAMGASIQGGLESKP